MFTQVLRALRERKGFSQSRLAREAGFTPSYISRLESGQRRPSYDAVLTLSRVMGLEGEERRRLFRAGGFVVPEEVLVVL